MGIIATTEPMYFPGSRTWRQVPINRGPGTPGIIDHYPEGPGETRPWEPPFSMGSPMPTIFEKTNPFTDNVALGTNPFGGGVIDGLAGRYGLWSGLGGLLGAGIGRLFNKK